MSRARFIGVAVCALSATVNAQTTTRASVDSSGAEVADGGRAASVSADGNVVAFTSTSPDLVPGDTNGVQDVFVHDRKTGVTERVSVNSGGVEGNADSSVGWPPVVSADGRFVAFHSGATNLVKGDTNKRWDVFVRDRLLGTTERVSVASGGGQSDGDSFYPGITPDGLFVAFQSLATNLVANDGNGVDDVFVHDRAKVATERVSVDSNGNEAHGISYCIGQSISADGDVVTFGSTAADLVPGDSNGADDVFVRVRSTGSTERVSVDSSGAEGLGDSFFSAISDDGLLVVFSSRAPNLVKGDLNGFCDVFVHDRSDGSTTRVSVDSSGGESDGDSAEINPAAISRDGRVVAFDSFAKNLDPLDPNPRVDAFRHDRKTGATSLVSQSCAGNPGGAASLFPATSGDGSVVVFHGASDNLVKGDGNGADDVFVFDLNVAADAAYWNNYGAGHPGLLGVPSLGLSAPPVFGSTISLGLGNSLGSATAGILIFGLAAIDVPTTAGGHLLASPDAILAGIVPAGGISFVDEVPREDAFCGLSIFLQMLQIDANASRGISFSPGLELHFGR